MLGMSVRILRDQKAINCWEFADKTSENL